MPRGGYPATVLEVVDAQMRFKRSVLRAVRGFAEEQPWRGSLDQRKNKFLRLNRSLSDAYGSAEPALHFGRIDGGRSGCSHYIPAQHRIVMVGKLSVVTYLHEFAHSRGRSERAACRWSINLFRRCFPVEYARLVGRGHMLIAPASLTRDNGQPGKSEVK